MQLTQVPRKWQMECLNSWILNDCKGIANVVTGAGKSLLGLMSADYLIKLGEKNLKILLVVPTKVLQLQWYDNFIELCGMDSSEIQLHGGGNKALPLENIKVHIMIINSALKILPGLMQNQRSNKHKTLLICDECHRYGSKISSHVFDYSFDYTLGLSATPEREGDFGFEEKIIPGLGNVIYKYGYDQAINDGIISEFKLTNISLALRKNEECSYKELTEAINKVLITLKSRYKILNNTSRFFASLEEIQKNNIKNKNRPDPNIEDFKLLCTKRKILLNRAEERMECLFHLLERLRYTGKIIIFHELIGELNIISKGLLSRGIEHILYHSEMREKDRLQSMDTFKNSKNSVLLACKALDEGLDIPDCSIAIIAASTKGSRQRIQRVGRMLRRTSENSFAWIISLFTRDTTEESRYNRNSEEQLFGAAEIEFLNYSANFAI